MRNPSSTASDHSHPHLGVVVPFANEEDTVTDLLNRILVHLSDNDRIYCILDNVSKDGTRGIIADYSKKDSRVILVMAFENRCVVDAYFRGYREAFKDGCEWILEMDGGFSHLPEEIPQFLEKMAEGFDYVGGSRFMEGGNHRSPFTRIIISKGGTILAAWFLKTQMTDMTSGFECFNRKAMALVFETGVQSKANFFQTEIRNMMHQLRWVEVPIQYANSKYGVGRSSIRDALKILWRLRRRFKS